jgi:aminocarboxymuconate-semialdehyde decarboxylase
VSAAPEGIDIHAHGVPRQFLEDVRRSGLAGVTVEHSDGRYLVTFPGGEPLRPVAGNMLAFSERLAWLDEQGMRQQLIGPWLDVHGQQLPAHHGQEWVRKLNDAMAEAVAGSHGRLRAHATLHLADAAAAATELERAATDLGMTGCMIPTHLPEGDLAESRYDALWEAAQSLGIPIVLHPPTVAPSNCLFGSEPGFRMIFGRLIDTTVTAARLILAGVPARFPELRLVLVHGGGFLPYQTGRFDREGAVDGALPSDQVRRFYYDTVLLSAPALRLLLELAGTGRVVIGSDYGAAPEERPSPRLTATLDELGPDEDTRRKVLWETAAALFGAGTRTRTREG